MSIYNQDVTRKHENRGVTIGERRWLGERRINPFSNFLDRKETRVYGRRLRPRPTSPEECLFKNRCPGKDAPETAAEETAATVWMMLSHGASAYTFPRFITIRTVHCAFTQSAFTRPQNSYSTGVMPLARRYISADARW